MSGKTFPSKLMEPGCHRVFFSENRSKEKLLINELTCYKNPSIASCIDLIITNRPTSFQNSYTFETPLSDFHKMTLTVLKISFKTKTQL